MIILFAGLPGTGKSTLAHALAERINGVVLDKDSIRAALFAPGDIEYSTAQDDFVMGIILQTAGHLLGRENSRSILIDGRPFSRRYQLEQVIQFAEQIGQPWRIFECVCSEETARARLQQSAQVHPAANRSFDLYLEVKGQFEEITFPKTVINTDNLLQACVQRAMLAIS